MRLLLAASAQEGDPCAGWSQRTGGSGLGRLENLEFDGRGGLYVSVSDGNRVDRVAPDGSATPFVDGVTSPGGLRVRGSHLLVTTDDSAGAAIERVDLATRRRVTLACGAAGARAGSWCA